MTREEMKDRIVRNLGLEHPLTIDFFKMCETLPEIKENDRLLAFALAIFEDEAFKDEEDY